MSAFCSFSRALNTFLPSRLPCVPVRCRSRLTSVYYPRCRRSPALPKPLTCIRFFPRLRGAFATSAHDNLLYFHPPFPVSPILSPRYLPRARSHPARPTLFLNGLSWRSLLLPGIQFCSASYTVLPLSAPIINLSVASAYGSHLIT